VPKSKNGIVARTRCAHVGVNGGAESETIPRSSRCARVGANISDEINRDSGRA
jgi:hypothetical protein